MTAWVQNWPTVNQPDRAERKMQRAHVENQEPINVLWSAWHSSAVAYLASPRNAPRRAGRATHTRRPEPLLSGRLSLSRQYAGRQDRSVGCPRRIKNRCTPNLTERGGTEWHAAAYPAKSRISNRSGRASRATPSLRCVFVEPVFAAADWKIMVNRASCDVLPHSGIGNGRRAIE